MGEKKSKRLCGIKGCKYKTFVDVVVVVFTLKAVPISTQYFLTPVMVQLTRTPPWSQANYPERVHIVKKKSKINKRTQKSRHTHDKWKKINK